MFENDADFDFSDDLGLNSNLKRPTDSAPREIKKPKTEITYLPKNVVKRKFPGPAGILPPRKDFDPSVLKSTTKSQTEEIACSQMSVSIFQNSPWLKMCEDYGKLVGSFNIKWIKTTASLNKLHNQKAPFLGAIIQNIECLDGKKPRVNVVLKDTSGEIQGTIIHNLYEEYSENLVVGAVIVIKQFGVLTTGSNNNHLTITTRNLVKIYTKMSKNNSEESEVRVINVQEVSYEDLIADSNTESEPKHDIFNDELIIPDNFEETVLKENKIEKPKFKFKKNTIQCDPLITIPSIFEDDAILPDNYDDCLLQETKNKFTFKKKNIIINSSQVCVSTNEEDSEIWQDVLEGVDTNSFFEDF